MKGSRRIALGGTQLDSLDSQIMIRSIVIGTPQESVSAVNRMSGIGQRITRRQTETLDVTVRFAMDIHKRELDDRRELLEKVNKWAMTHGWLTVNYMDGKRLWTEYAALPGAADLWNWTDDYAITFRAYGVPYWQDATATSDSSGILTVPGQVTTVCEADVTNGTGSTINSLTVTAGSSSFVFADLGLADGETLKIGHEPDGTLWIRIANSQQVTRNVFSKRTGASSDDLYVEPGARSVSASAGTATFKCFGRYA